jgi:hypothetical protein
MLQRRSSRKSSNTQVIPPNADASMEFQMAIIARKFAPNAEPPLNPSHPNHKTNVPKYVVIGKAPDGLIEKTYLD